MIKLTKLEEPTVLRENKARWTEEYIAAKEANSPDLEAKKTVYNHPDIKA